VAAAAVAAICKAATTDSERRKADAAMAANWLRNRLPFHYQEGQSISIRDGGERQ